MISLVEVNTTEQHVEVIERKTKHKKEKTQATANGLLFVYLYPYPGADAYRVRLCVLSECISILGKLWLLPVTDCQGADH